MNLYQVTDYSTGEVFFIEAESAEKAAEGFRKDGKAVKITPFNPAEEKGKEMDTFLVKYTGSDKWIQMQAESKEKLAERLKKEGKSGKIRPLIKTQEKTVKTPAPPAALVKLEKMTPEEVAEITALLEKNVLPHLQSDVSNYAKGRQRVWLPYEAPLGNQPFTAGLLDGEVWQWIVDRCAKHGFKAQVALISKGGNINPHRDTTFAAAWAMGFNLGKCDWHIGKNHEDVFGWN